MNHVKLLVQAIELAQSPEYWTPLISEALPSVRFYHISVHDQDESIISVSLHARGDGERYEFLYGRHIGVVFGGNSNMKLHSELSNFAHLDDIITLIQVVPNFQVVGFIEEKLK